MPQFDGTGYMGFIMPETKSIRHITSFGFELKTTSKDGMILWIGEDLTSDDYLGTQCGRNDKITLTRKIFREINSLVTY